MDKSAMVIRLIGLVKECPAGNRRCDCPSGKLGRKYTPRQVFVYLDSMETCALAGIIAHHNKCFLQQESLACSKLNKVNGIKYTN